MAGRKTDAGKARWYYNMITEDLLANTSRVNIWRDEAVADPKRWDARKVRARQRRIQQLVRRKRLDLVRENIRMGC